MPLYEYQCDDCGKRFERIRKFSDPPLDEPCPTCGGPIRKLLSSPAIQFKGKGWYVTDYAKSGSSEGSKSDSSSESSGKDKPAATTPTSETKADTKTEAPKATPATTDKK
jgi:putative FmdB family regulatory protein